MFDRISYTWSLMRASWDVLKSEKALIFFPLFSGISCIVVMASFAMPLAMLKPDHAAANADPMQKVYFYGVLFLFYFCNYFVITFFNTALTSCAITRMAGGEPSFSAGLGAAFSRIHLIAGWALVSATIGLALRMIAERSKRVGAIVAMLLGGVWSIITYLVVPVIVVENKGPIAALKESSSLLKKAWGDQITGNFSFGIIFFLLGLPGYAMIFGAIYMGAAMSSGMVTLVLIGLAVVYLIGLALISSVLQSIFQAAVYMYTQNALMATVENGRGFPVQLVKHAMR
jgi:hypothetical protein